jgi:hypothetical protein
LSKPITLTQATYRGMDRIRPGMIIALWGDSFRLEELRRDEDGDYWLISSLSGKGRTFAQAWEIRASLEGAFSGTG